MIASRGPALIWPEAFRGAALALVGGLAAAPVAALGAGTCLAALGVATAALVGRPRGLFDGIMWLLAGILVVSAPAVVLSPDAWWGYSEQLLAAVPAASLRWGGVLGLLIGGGLVLLAVAGRDA